MNQVNGVRYVTPLREGGSLPAIVDTDEPGAYVVKFRGAGQGPKALVAELLAAILARPLGLPAPAAAIVTLAAGFGQSEPDPEIQDLLRASVGRNFGLRYLPGALAFDPAVDRAVAPDLAAAIVWFDAYLTNVDRTPRNTNLLWWPTARGQQPALYLIDHGAALYFHHRWEGWESRIQSAFPQIKDHVLLPFAGNLLAADARLRPLLTPAVIRHAVAAIPDDWLGDEALFADRAAQRDAYNTYLLARLTGPRHWLREASDAAARTRLV
jgi:hypothetical protein